MCLGAVKCIDNAGLLGGNFHPPKTSKHAKKSQTKIITNPEHCPIQTKRKNKKSEPYPLVKKFRFDFYPVLQTD